MAEIVLGIGTSHSPILSMEPAAWVVRAQTDGSVRKLIDNAGRMVSYDELLAAADPKLEGEIAEDKLQARHAANQRGIATIRDALYAAKPDVLIMFGDDHMEVYHHDNMPSLGIYTGETIKYTPNRVTKWPYAPELRTSLWYPTEDSDYPVAAPLARRLAEDLCEKGFDMAYSQKYQAGVGMSHSFAYVYHRLLTKGLIPTIPIHLNTYFPPNQVTPRRCYELGRAIRASVESWDPKLRVAILGSGGLSHFVIDEALDRQLLDALGARDPRRYEALPRHRLNSGNSELRMWVAAAGAVDHMRFNFIDYIPCYRSPAGTGCGIAFVTWH